MRSFILVFGRSFQSFQRAKLFKAGVGRDEARRGRNETQVQIRKEKKEERLNQRRRKGGDANAAGGFSFGAIPEGGAPASGTSTSADAANNMRVGGRVDVIYCCVAFWRGRNFWHLRQVECAFIFAFYFLLLDR